MALKLTISRSKDPGPRQEFMEKITRLNEKAIGQRIRVKPFKILVSDPKTRRVLGGLWGHSALDHLHIGLLFLDESVRGRGIGRRLMRMAEAEARQRGCVAVWLDTMSFQAPGFYKTLGYTVFGSLPDRPRGHRQYFLVKRLKRPRRGAVKRPSSSSRGA